MRTRIKICGITRPDDGVAAVRLGVDAIGLVFYAPSPRYVTVTQARAVTDVLPPFVTVVGLFVNAGEEMIEQALAQVPLTLLQFHGDESPEDCRVLGLPYIKAVRVRGADDVAQAAAHYHDARALLLDAYQADVPGGTGKVFDWNLIPRALDKPLILAGGLTADNVADAIRHVRPYAVDVSGGVEERKGIKSADKMAAFVSRVETTNREQTHG